MVKTKKQELFLIVLAYSLAGIFYAFATPPLEASDEYKHYPFVQFIQNNWRLPVLEPDDPGRWLQEAAQPPLYYILSAMATLPIDTNDLSEIHQVNPHAFVGNPNQTGNKNLIVHSPETEAFPWTGAILAVYLIRFVSIGLGVGTILLVFHLGQLIFNERVGLLGAAFTAFNPMFLFVHAAVNNDSLSIFLGHLGLFLLVRLWLDTPEPGKHWRPYLTLGIALGLGLLTKLSLGGLLGLAGLVLAWKAWQQKSPELFFVGGPLIVIPALLIPAPWLWRNWQLYGDFTGLNVFVAVADARLEAMAWADWVGEFGTFYRSFWGLFGGINVAPPELFYNLYNLFAIMGTAAFLLWLRNNRDHFVGKGLWLLVAWPILLFLLLLRWNMMTPAFQGRLIFPGLGALNLLWAVGFLYLAQRSRVEKPLAFGLPVVAFLVAALLPYTTIRPAYRHPKPLVSMPAEAAFGPFTFRDGEGEIQLVGVEIASEQSVEPGGGNPVEVTLYWRMAEPVSKDYLSAVHLLGRDNVPIGHVNRYPAMGMVPTSQWEAGQIWRDVYNVYASEAAEAPTRLRVLASLYDAEEDVDIVAVGPDGSPTELLIVGEARLATSETAEPEIGSRLEVSLADNVTLLGYDLSPQSPQPGDAVTLDLYWRADGRPSLDYTVFVQLIDSNSSLLASGDGPPLNGDFPTSWWRAGDVITDTHLLLISAEVAPGAYTILVGLYDPNTGQRPIRLDGRGDAIQLPLMIEK